MGNLQTRINQLEKINALQDAPGDSVAWVEMLDGGLAVLRYQDARRVDVSQADVPHGVKCYRAGFSPDDWRGVTA